MPHDHALIHSDESLMNRLVRVETGNPDLDSCNPLKGVHTMAELFERLGFYGFRDAFSYTRTYYLPHKRGVGEQVCELNLRLIDCESGKEICIAGALRVIDRLYDVNAREFHRRHYVRTGAKQRKTRYRRQPEYISAMREYWEADDNESVKPKIRAGYIEKLRWSFGRWRVSWHNRNWKQFRGQQYKARNA